MCCSEGRFVPGGSKARLKADRATAAWRRTATYRGELRSCFTGWLPLFKIIPFACSWDYICLSDQASGNHLGTNARPSARAGSDVNLAFPCIPGWSLHLSFSFPPSLFPSLHASLFTRFKHTWKIRVVSVTASRDFRRDSANVTAARIGLTFFLFHSFFWGIFLFWSAKKRPHRERWLVTSVFIEQ